MFYDFDQNNSGGYFVVNDKLCHMLFIEADSKDEAVRKAEELGCYLDGVRKGIDCPCCGDRWDKDYIDAVPLDKYRTEGYQAWGNDIIYFKDIEEYAQYVADVYGWTVPDGRIYYKDGTVKEIFSNRR